MPPGRLTYVIQQALVRKFGRDSAERIAAGIGFLFACGLLTILLTVDIPIDPGSVTRSSIVVDSLRAFRGKSQSITIHSGNNDLTISGATFRGAYTLDTLADRITRAGEIDIWTSPTEASHILGLSAPEVEIPASSGLAAEASNRTALVWLTGGFFALSFLAFWNPSFRRWRKQRAAARAVAEPS